MSVLPQQIIFNNYHLQSTSIHDQCHDSSFMISLICNVRWNSLDFGTLVIDLWSYGDDNNIKSYFEFNIFFIPTRKAIKNLLSFQQFPCSNSKLDNIELSKTKFESNIKSLPFNSTFIHSIKDNWVHLNNSFEHCNLSTCSFSMCFSIPYICFK